MISEPFNPEDFDFFLRKEAIYPPDIQFYELDHPSIDKTKLKDWKRLNYFLSKDGDYITIWYGLIDVDLADELYKKEYGFNVTAEQNIENRFRGHITTKQEAKVILKALRIKSFPQYLG